MDGEKGRGRRALQVLEAAELSESWCVFGSVLVLLVVLSVYVAMLAVGLYMLCFLPLPLLS
jgi:hypothetical protein